MITSSALVSVTILLPIINWSQISNYVPIHWGRMGEVTRYTAKTPYVFFTGPLLQIGTIFSVMITVNNFEKKSEKSVTSTNQSNAYQFALSKYVLSIGFIFVLLFLFLQYFIVFSVKELPYLWNIFGGVFIVWVILGSIYTYVKYVINGE